MRLYITDSQVEPLSGYVLKPADLAYNMAHLVIASQRWEECYIDVSDAVPDGCVRLLTNQCDAILPAVPEILSMHEMHVLCDLFPKLAGSIRKAFMQKKSVYDILPNRWSKEG